MKSNFNDCLARVLKDEGGYTNDPQDPGGPTNYGITLKDVQLYVKKNATASDVKALTLDQAKTIYRSKYWNSLDCDNLPSGVDYTCFDYGVNSGLGRPRKALQRFKSLSGTKLINAINDERMTFLQGLNTYARFGKGWAARVSRVRSHSIELASKPNLAAPTAASTITGSAGVALSHFWSAHQVSILITTVVVAILTGAAVYLYNHKRT